MSDPQERKLVQSGACDVVKLSELVPDGAIVPSMKATARDDAVKELVAALISSGAAPESLREELITRVLERERRGSTGFGKGVAVPHVKHPSVTKMHAAIGLSDGGINFNSLDHEPVYSVFLLLSPENDPEAHLKAMETIFKNLSHEHFRRFLRQAGTVEEVRTLLDEADAQVLGR